MLPEWTIIYQTANAMDAALVQSYLEGNGLAVVVLNKQDSSYLNFGEIQIFVHESHFAQGIELLALGSF